MAPLARFLLLVGTGFSAVVAVAQPAPDAVPMGPAVAPPPMPKTIVPRTGEPAQWLEQDIRAFVDQLNALGTMDDTIGSRYVDGRLGYFGANDFLRQVKQYSKDYVLKIDSIAIDKLENGVATVTISSSVQGRNGAPAPAEIPPFKETTTWRLGAPTHRLLLKGEEKNLWRIIPNPANLNVQQILPLNYSAMGLGQLPDASALSAANGAMNRARTLALMISQFVQDYDNQYLFDNAHLREALKPYARDESVYSIPNTQLDFNFNEALSGHTPAEIGDISKIPLIYDGSAKTLNYRYGGRALVTFVDGHGQLITPEEAEKLQWEPGK